MNDVINVRTLQKSDVDGLLLFVNSLISEDTFLMLSGDLMKRSQEKSYVFDSLSKIKKHEKIHFIAIDGNKIVGSGEIRRGYARKRHIGEIGLSVIKAYRTNGVGTMLLRKLISSAQRLALRLLVLHVFANNSPAITLYKKFGFIECGRLPKAYFWRGKFIDEVTFYKEI